MFRSMFAPSFVRRAGTMLLAVGTLLGAGAAVAAPLTMSLSSTTDLTHLHVGDTFTVNATLGGLAPLETLNLLSATAQFSGTSLGAPSAVTVGAIVPGGAGNPDVSTVSGLNFAEADFQTFGSTPASQVAANGNYFSFTMTAGALGTGNIFLSFVDALDGDPSNPGVPGITAGAALAFAVIPAAGGGGGGGGVPLPAALLPGIFCIAALGLALNRRHAMG